MCTAHSNQSDIVWYLVWFSAHNCIVACFVVVHLKKFDRSSTDARILVLLKSVFLYIDASVMGNCRSHLQNANNASCRPVDTTFPGGGLEIEKEKTS